MDPTYPFRSVDCFRQEQPSEVTSGSGEEGSWMQPECNGKCGQGWN